MKKLIVLIMVCIITLSMVMTCYAEEVIADVESGEIIKGVVDDSNTESDVLPDDVAEDIENAKAETWSGAFLGFIKENFTESSLIAFALALASFCIEHFSSNKNLKKHIGILNGNAIEIAETSAKKTDDNTQQLQLMKEQMTAWQEALEGKISLTLNVVTKTAEEREALEAALAKNNDLMNKAVIALMENSDEIANLLLMSNIPTSKKEEMYNNHYEAVKAIKGVVSEVNTGDGE